IVARCRLAEAAANLVLSIILVRSIGLLGVAIGTTVPHLLLTGLVLPCYTCHAAGLSLAEFYARVVGRGTLASRPFLIGAPAPEPYVRFPSLLLLFSAIGALTAVHLLTFMLSYFGWRSLRHPGASISSLLHGDYWTPRAAA